MTAIQEVDQIHAKQHETETDANVTLGGYHMDDYCPQAEVKCYRAILESSDMERIYLLNESTFKSFTRGETFKVTDMVPDAGNPKRVKSFVNSIDLRDSPQLAPILVGTSLHDGSLTVIDGNHRITAQYLMHQSLEGVPIYVYIHPNMNKWGFVPYAAR